MQGDKTALATVLEAAANVAASAKSGLDKTKAVFEEKLEKMSTSDEVEKDMAKLRKEEKIDLAELRKVKAYAQNAVAAASSGSATSPKFTDGGHFTTIGSFDRPAAITSTNTADPASRAGPDKKTDSSGNEAMDSNPTRTGMSEPVVQPASGDTGFGSAVSSDTNTHMGPK